MQVQNKNTIINSQSPHTLSVERVRKVRISKMELHYEHFTLSTVSSFVVPVEVVRTNVVDSLLMSAVP